MKFFRKTQLPAVPQIESVISQTEGVHMVISNPEYLSNIFEAYQHGLSVDGNEVPRFNYEIIGKNELRITGDVAGVLSWLQCDGLLTKDCTKQYQALELPPSSFSEMNIAPQNAITCP